MLALQLTHTLGQLLQRRSEVFHLLPQGVDLLRGRHKHKVVMWWEFVWFNDMHSSGFSGGINLQANDKTVAEAESKSLSLSNNNVVLKVHMNYHYNVLMASNVEYQ